GAADRIHLATEWRTRRPDVGEVGRRPHHRLVEVVVPPGVADRRELRRSAVPGECGLQGGFVGDHGTSEDAPEPGARSEVLVEESVEFRSANGERLAAEGPRAA